MNSSLRLLITGPLPPPKGGVSVHIERLVGLLTSLGLEVELIDESPIRKAGEFNVRSLNVFGYLARFWRSDVVHVHSSVDVFRIGHSMMALIFRRPLLITLHSWRPRGWVSRNLHAWIFKKAKTVVCVSEPIAEQVGSNAVAIRPAFIPPTMDTETELPENIADWLDQQKSDGNVLIASNAYQLDSFEGNDIYGTDLCISMMHALVKQHEKNVALVFNVASLAKGRELYARYHRLIRQLDLHSQVLLTNEPDLSFVRLLEYTHMSIRATNTDGDALSIREGLFLGKPVIASDVVKRPAGTRLFANRNVDSLVAAVELELDALRSGVSTIENIPGDDSPEFYSSLYSGVKGAFKNP